MGKFDLEKFVTSILSLEFDKNEKEKIVNWVVSQDVKTPLKIVQLAFYKALNEQGLEFEDGEIKEKALCFEEDKWYVFTHASLHYDTINGEVTFEKDKPYRCLGGETFLGDGGDYCFRGQEDMLRNLRPATEEEIEEISGNNGGISSNYELTEFERKLADMLYGWNSELNKESQDRTKKWAKELLDISRKEILKDMPKWKRHHILETAVLVNDGNDVFALYKSYKINLTKLFDLLPKEE